VRSTVELKRVYSALRTELDESIELCVLSEERHSKEQLHLEHSQA